MRNALILGCGYLGQALVPCLEPSYARVFATSRGAARRRAAAPGAEWLTLDCNEAATWPALEGVAKAAPLDVFSLIPPSGVHLKALARFLDYLARWPLRRALLVSSTVVYGQQSRDVDADAEVAIDSPRAERQHAVEQAWQALGPKLRIVRLAGLYGPERLVGARTVRAGKVLSGNPQGWLNLIHVDDAARLLTAVASGLGAAAVELGCDGTPVRRQAYYQALARHLGCAAVRFHNDSAAPGRRCHNGPTVRRTGWRPRHPDSVAFLA